jgi:hypothetical protein
VATGCGDFDLSQQSDEEAIKKARAKFFRGVGSGYHICRDGKRVHIEPRFAE